MATRTHRSETRTSSSPDGTGTAAGAPPVVVEPGAREVVATTLRGLLAAAVLLSAVVHLELWAHGMHAVAVIGPAFLLNAVGGLAIALAVLLWRHWLPLVGAAGFGAATLGAFLVSVTVGLFGVHERFEGVPQMLSAVSEVLAVVLAIVALVVEVPLRGSRRALAGDHPR